MWGKMQISSTEGPQVASISYIYSIGKDYTVPSRLSGVHYGHYGHYLG